jgi:LysM repeat protein
MSCPTAYDSYYVQPGDTLNSIAEKVYGNSQYWWQIRKTDGSAFTEQEAQKLQINQEICIWNSRKGPGPFKP